MFLFSEGLGVEGESTRVWEVVEVVASLSGESEALDVNLTTGTGVAGRDTAGVAALESGDPINCTPRRAVKICSSVKIPNGSRLLRIVPVNSVGSIHSQISISPLTSEIIQLTLRYHNDILS